MILHETLELIIVGKSLSVHLDNRISRQHPGILREGSLGKCLDSTLVLVTKCQQVLRVDTIGRMSQNCLHQSRRNIYIHHLPIPQHLHGLRFFQQKMGHDIGKPLDFLVVERQDNIPVTHSRIQHDTITHDTVLHVLRGQIFLTPRVKHHNVYKECQ